MAKAATNGPADHTLSLREARAWNGITLDDLAKETGFSSSWLNRAERGYRTVSPEREQAIREAIARIIARRHEQRH